MRKTLKALLIAVVIIAVAATGFLFLGGAVTRNARNSIVRSSTRYTVSKGNLSLTAVGSGRIVSSDVETVIPQGSIKEIKAHVGDYVKKGDLLATIVNTRGNDEDFTSDYEVVVTAVPGASTYTPLASSQTAAAASSSGFEISDVNSLQMDIQATEQDVYKIKVGQAASIYIDALDLTVKGTVSRISLSGDTSGDFSTYDVTVTFKKSNSNIFLGMTGSAKITVETKKNVVKIPTDALIEQNGKRYVLSSEWLNHLNMPQSDYYTEVKTGLADTDYVEITGGNIAGTEILILSSSSGSAGFSLMGRSSSSGSTK
ncbi:MAG: HlyD family efflux transporter periplasmic adaptor subunit [Clostridia bacterium]|nr:HlyD family efflux transporter periplasmic adaptor subunit [Clostridia bacterium]